MREIYATPHKQKPEVLAIAVDGAEVLLRHGDNRWIRFRPATAREFGEMLVQASAEAANNRQPKTDDEMDASFGARPWADPE